jgi:hypothetical protein
MGTGNTAKQDQLTDEVDLPELSDIQECKQLLQQQVAMCSFCTYMIPIVSSTVQVGNYDADSLALTLHF